MTDPTLTLAREWLEGPLWQEVVRLVYRRQIFRRFLDIYNAAPEVVQESGPELMRWAMNNYGHTQAMAIRKLNDRNRNVQSFHRLLLNLAELPDFAEDVTGDLERLEKGVEDVTDFVDTVVAHLADPEHIHPVQQKRIESVSVTFITISDCVDLYAELLKRYSSRLLDSSPWLDDVITPPWDYAFRFAWITDEESDDEWSDAITES